MALYDISELKDLGAQSGTHSYHDDVLKAVKEVQGLRVVRVAGATATTKIAVAAIRAEDTILAGLVVDTAAAAGSGIADDTANFSISNIKATGTLTFVSAIATDVFVINGVTWTVITGVPTKDLEVQVGGTDTAMGENAVAQINKYLASVAGSAEAYTVSEATGVVTVNSTVEGTAGNAITIASVDSTITASGANLTGGTATGGVASATDNSSKDVILMWFDKQ